MKVIRFVIGDSPSPKFGVALGDRAAMSRSPSDTILQRSNTALVLRPVICIATLR